MSRTSDLTNSTRFDVTARAIDEVFDDIQTALPEMDDAAILHLLQRIRGLIPWIDIEYARRVSTAMQRLGAN